MSPVILGIVSKQKHIYISSLISRNVTRRISFISWKPRKEFPDKSEIIMTMLYCLAIHCLVILRLRKNCLKRQVVLGGVGVVLAGGVGWCGGGLGRWCWVV